MKIKILLILLAFNQFVYTESLDHCDNCDKYNNLLSHKSIVYELARTASGIDFEASKCKDDLTLIGDGIERNNVWAFKSK